MSALSLTILINFDTNRPLGHSQNDAVLDSEPFILTLHREANMAKMKRHERILAAERSEEIRLAFLAWYETFPRGKKRDGMMSIGISRASVPGSSGAFRKGLRTPPPRVLAALWRQTQDERFLLTRDEKARYRQMGRVGDFPGPDEWPDKDSDAPRAPPGEEAEPESSELSGPTVPLSTVLEAHGGETSLTGVRFVLGESSFVEIDLDPPQDLVAFIERQIELVRGLLNVLTQIRDPVTRKKIQGRIGRQVEELDLAIRLFSAVHPNQLTRLHDDQRNAWIGNGQGKH